MCIMNDLIWIEQAKFICPIAMLLIRKVGLEVTNLPKVSLESKNSSED